MSPTGTCTHTVARYQHRSAGRMEPRGKYSGRTSPGRGYAGSTIGAAKRNNASVPWSPSRPDIFGTYGVPGNMTSFFAAQPLIVCLQPSLQCDPLAILIKLLLRLSRTWKEEPASYASTRCNMYEWGGPYVFVWNLQLLRFLRQ